MLEYLELKQEFRNRAGAGILPSSGARHIDEGSCGAARSIDRVCGDAIIKRSKQNAGDRNMGDLQFNIYFC